MATGTGQFQNQTPQAHRPRKPHDHYGLCKGIDDGEGFTVPVVSDALALKVHVVAGTGAREGAVGVHTVSESAFGLLVLAVFAVL